MKCGRSSFLEYDESATRDAGWCSGRIAAVGGVTSSVDVRVAVGAGISVGSGEFLVVGSMDGQDRANYRILNRSIVSGRPHDRTYIEDESKPTAQSS